jgi:hypothetical protein
MKSPIPARRAICLLLALPTLAGCGSRSTTMALSPAFVPAGYSRPAGSPSALLLTQGDPSVSASVKAHYIPGVPASQQFQAAPGGPPHP